MSGQFNQKAYDLGSRLESALGDEIKRLLRLEYGEKGWWRDGIPKPIQKKCAERRIDDGTGELDEAFLDLIDFQKIIREKNNKALLLSTFTAPGLESVAVDKRLSWLSSWNKARIKYSHPSRSPVTQADFEELAELASWLAPRLGVPVAGP